MAALAEFGGKMDRGLGRRATADVLWDQVRSVRDTGTSIYCLCTGNSTCPQSSPLVAFRRDHVYRIYIIGALLY